jgi:hypothetical protein
MCLGIALSELMMFFPVWARVLVLSGRPGAEGGAGDEPSPQPADVL